MISLFAFPPPRASNALFCNSASLICFPPPPAVAPLLFPPPLLCHRLRVSGAWRLPRRRLLCDNLMGLGGRAGGGSRTLQNVLDGRSGIRSGSSAHPLALLLAAACSVFKILFFTEDASMKEFDSTLTTWDWDFWCTCYAENVRLKCITGFLHSLNHVSAFLNEESVRVSNSSKDYFLGVFLSPNKQQNIAVLGEPPLFHVLASTNKSDEESSDLNKVLGSYQAEDHLKTRQGDPSWEFDPKTNLTLDESDASLETEDVPICKEVKGGSCEETSIQDIYKEARDQELSRSQPNCENENVGALPLSLRLNGGTPNKQHDLSGITKNFSLISSSPKEKLDTYRYGTQSHLNVRAGDSKWMKQVEDSGGTDLSTGNNLDGFQKSTRSLKMVNPTLKGESQVFLEDKKGGAKKLVGSSKEEGIVLSTLEQEADPENFLKLKLATVRQMADAGSAYEARNLCQQLLEEFPGNPRVLLQYAHAEREFGNLVAARALFSDAVLAFRRISDFGPTYIRALQVWGSVEMKVKEFTKARYLFVESFRAARKIELSSPENFQGASVYGLHSWAMLEEKLGNWSKARELLERAESIQPGNAVVQMSRALLEMRGHNYSTARYYFKLAAESAPEDVKCWQAWALFEANQAKPAKMRKLFMRALSVSPNNLHSLQAWAHQESLIGTNESRSRARNLYKKCTDVDPRNLFSWQSWAILEQKSGNIDEARKLFEKALTISPSSVPCLQAFAYMERMSHNLKAAQKLLKKALVLEPENAAVLMEAALVEKSLGHDDAALEFFKSARRSDKQKSRLKRKMFIARKNSPPLKPRRNKRK